MPSTPELLAAAWLAAVALALWGRNEPPPRTLPARPTVAYTRALAAARNREQAARYTQLAHARRYRDLVDAGALTVVDATVDPGNPGALLHLAHDTHGLFTEPGGRILLAENPPTGDNPDPTIVVIPVDPRHDNALTAAAATYGLTPDVYSTLTRRT